MNSRVDILCTGTRNVFKNRYKYQMTLLMKKLNKNSTLKINAS